MDVIVTAPERGGKVWQLTDLFGRSMGCITESGANQFTISPAGRRIGNHGGNGDRAACLARCRPGRDRKAHAGASAGPLLAQSNLGRGMTTGRTADRFDSISANKEISTLCDRLFCLRSEWEVLLSHCAVIRPIAAWRWRELPWIVIVENSENGPRPDAWPDQFHENKFHLCSLPSCQPVPERLRHSTPPPKKSARRTRPAWR